MSETMERGLLRLWWSYRVYDQAQPNRHMELFPDGSGGIFDWNHQPIAMWNSLEEGVATLENAAKAVWRDAGR